MCTYAGCSGACVRKLYVRMAGSSGAGHVHLQNFGFLEEKLSDGLAKNASKRAKCQVCICREI
jgi:hypothetical protein